MFFLELLWAEPAKRGVDPDPVVEALYALEYLERGLFPAGEGARVHAFRLDDPHQGFRDGVVPRARDRPHGRRDSVLLHGLADQQRHVLAPAARMMQAAPLRAPARYRHPKGASASSAVIPGAMGRPTTSRGHTSITAAGHGQP